MKLEKHAWGIWGIALVVVLALALLLPFVHNAVYYIALASMLLAFGLCAWSFRQAFTGKDGLFSKYLGWPVFRVGLTVLAVQAVLGFGLMALSPLCPAYAAILPEILLFAAAGVCLIARDAARQAVEQGGEALPDRTAAWKEVRRKAALVELPGNARWQKLLEDIRFADPTDDERSAIHTQRILELLDSPVDEEAMQAIQKLIHLRRQRG